MGYHPTLQQIGQLVHCPIDSEKHITGVSVDTRTLQPGNLYVALKGEKVDGHDFIKDAAEKGAAAALVSHNYSATHVNLPLLKVEDPLHALQEWAKQLIARRKTRIVAVTGSIGKTTTKEFIKTLLETNYRVAASPGNSNSQIGLPLAILNHTTGDEEILILEMGMTHPGQITRLIQIAPPEVAVITTVALVHACNFDSLEDIAWAKSEILSHPHTRLGIIPKEIANYGVLVNFGHSHKIFYSTQCADGDYYLDPHYPQVIQAFVEKQMVQIKRLTVPGTHNLHNLLAAMIVARHFKLGWEEIADRIPALQLPERRLQFTNHNGITFVNDSYNASELSVKAALSTLPQPVQDGSRIAVLGSMMELGKFSIECHQRVGEWALNHVDRAYCLGEECRPIYNLFKEAGRPTELFVNRQELVKYLRAILKPKDVVLLKGSRSKELWKVLEEI